MSLGINGLLIKRLADIKPEIEAAFGDAFGVDNVDLTNDGPIGQLVGIMADREASLWELFEQVVASASETGSSGILLDQLYLIVNLFRLQAAPSRTIDSDGVTFTTLLSGTPGTVVPVDFVLDTSDTAVRFLNHSEVTIGGGGTVLADFRCVDDGPTKALAGTLTVIPVPLAGLTSATNTQDAAIGRFVETDTAFRARRATAAAVVAASTAPALVAALLAVEGVLEVKEIQNRSDSPDLEGRPGHSFECVVRGGADQDILEQIFERQPSGIETFGSTTGSVTDLHGDAQPVSFSRPTGIPVYIDVDLTVDGLFPADGIDQVRDAILAYGQAEVIIGMQISAFKIEQTIETPGIVICDFRLGTGPSPATSDPIDIGSVEIAEFDSTRLNVLRVN